MNRHHVSLREALILIVLILAAGLALFEFDFGSAVASEKRIDFQEAVILAVLFMASIVWFGWRRIVEQEREIARRLEAERRAHELAHTDALTGLPNRRSFERALNEAAGSPPGAERVHALLSIDLNKFKRINDLFGHAEGDEALVIVAQRLCAAMREGDLLARLGGDEFAVVARHLAGPEVAIGIATRIVKALESPIEIGANRHRVGAAVGIALMPRDHADPGAALRQADLAMYRAKAEKDSAARFFEPEFDAQSRERDLIERELAKALATGAFAPWYQPIFDLEGDRIIGFEALARWTHPTLGEVSPDRFIPVAEDCGLMDELSDHLLRCACREALNWPDDVFLSFNISPSQLKELTLGLHILKILAETGLPPQRLEIEITENAIVRDLEAAKSVLASLRDAGVRIALDDFGTGYSNLYHLRSFKFDAIKIDRSFVNHMGSEDESAAIVRALTGLGHGLGLMITAEGVEDPAQRQSLLEQGCQRGQGFLFSPAVPAQAARELLGRPTAPLLDGARGVRAAG